MITPRGLGFLAAAVALFLLARLTQVGWLYLLDSVLWGALLLSAILPWLVTLFLVGRRRVVPTTASEGQPSPSEGDSVDIEVLPDGSLLVSNDFAYCIYRISFSE